MLGLLFFVALIVFGLWKIVSATVVIRLHTDDQDDKMVLIPQHADPTNPLVASAGFIRWRAKATRRTWVTMTIYSILVPFGLFTTMGPALIGLLVVFVVVQVLNGLLPGPK
jgi:Mn2+/Fe2+ NRAMP family transporter